MKKFLLYIIITMIAMPVYAATLRVERDGSADFTVIQDAVNAAASGDTVYIGPGRYNEGEIVSTNGWTEFVRVFVPHEELTLIGAGPNETILGPTTPWDYSTQGEDIGIVGGPFFGSNSIFIERIGFENMGAGIVGCTSPDFVVINNCSFESNYFSLSICSGNSIEVESSIFKMAPDWGSLIQIGRTDVVSLLDCEFIFEEDPLYFGVMVQMDGVDEAVVQNCTFSEGGYGLRIVSGSGNAQILGCRFTGQNTSGLDLSGYHATVDNCIFEQQEIAVGTFTLSTDLLFTNSIITDVTDVSFYIFGVDEFEVSNSIIAHGLDYSIRQPEYRENETSTDLHQLLMINNDWGTTDAETIASWISLRDYEALYIPFIGQPVATESISFDGLKALFRGEVD